MPLLTIDRLGRDFGGREVVGSLDLELQPGQRLALRGPNGSGKTTVLRCVAGTLLPHRGEIRIDGHLAGSMAARRLAGASLAQERSFYMRLTGRMNLLFFARLRCAGEPEVARQVTALEEELELSEILAKRVDACSAGMLQQLAFARALLGAPRLLILDEPTRSLDNDAVRRLWAAILRRPETAALVATHRDGDLEYCDGHLELPT
jgi:ABC-2 type transport system ATP-binding protein